MSYIPSQQKRSLKPTPSLSGQVTTPTLILHGENDPAVPVAQAYAFYRALRERNIPVELVVYPREGHGLNERATSGYVGARFILARHVPPKNESEIS